jgi:hypothetical protein
MIKNKISLKTIIIGVILLLVGVLGVLGVNTAKTYLSGASADTVPKTILGKASDDGKSAVITWTTDKATQGIVEYGTTPASLLLMAPESDQGTSHSVNLSPLKAGTNYYFRIKIGDQEYDNDGIPYSFKSGEAVVTPTAVPTAVLIPTAPVGTQSGTSGSCDRTTDYNKDGVTNSLDYMYCMKNLPTGSAAPSVGNSKCPAGVDYNKDGVVNSLDVIKCLQDNK